VVEQPLSPDAIAAAVDDPGAGGIVIFSGVVRNETGGRSVKFLEYEAHAPMAEAKMREIGRDLRGRWPGVKRVAMLHRTGRLEIGESSVLIAVSAAHRQDAFDACRFAIDTLKRTVPVWKKEHFDDGGPGVVDRATVGKIQVEPLSPGGFTVPGEESDSNAHRTSRSGGTARSRSSTSRSGC
jgi:molybdopterin synthase catalytic subunit